MKGNFKIIISILTPFCIEIFCTSLLVADFCAATILISFGAVIGKATISQLIIMATIEVVIQNVNQYIGVEYFKVKYLLLFNQFRKYKKIIN